MTELLYFANAVNTLGVWLAGFGTVVVAISLTVYVASVCGDYADNLEEINKRFKKPFIIALACLSLGVVMQSFAPDKKTMAVLATVYVIENTEGIESVTPAMVKALNEYLKDDKSND